MTRVLVATAHPDDAELAVGGTIAALTARGVEVTVGCFTVSEPGSALRPQRIAAAERAAEVLGHHLSWVADGRHDQVEDMPEYEVVRHMDDLVRETQPDAVLTHWDGDSHGDHVRIARAALSSSRRWPDVSLFQFGPNEYRTVRHAEFVPNVYVPMAHQLARKAEALACYAYPDQGFRPLDTSASDLLDRARGVTVGLPAAEGLRLVRHRHDPTRPSIF